MNEEIKPTKSFLRRFWWLGLILIILIVGFVYAWFAGHNQSKSGNDKTEPGKTETNVSLAEDLPACPADSSTIFTKAFMADDKPDFIVPLGNSNSSGHVVPVDHVYPSDKGYEENMPVYAPGDMTLIWVENKQMHNSTTNEITRADYQLNFAPCRGLNLAFIHIDKLSSKLEEAIEDENSNCANNQKMDYGTQEGIPTYYVTCHPDFKKIRISAGETIGYFSGQTDKNFSGFDIGMYDFNKPALGFINPARYYQDSVHTACFADYYTSDLKTKYLAKMGGYANKKGSDEQEFTHPVTNTCGKVMWDVRGTVAGNWFKNPLAQTDQTTDSEALVLIHDNIEPELAKISWAEKNISFTFTPSHSNTTNREFSEVKADGKIYCYQSSENENNTYLDKSGKTVTNDSSNYLLELVDDTHLKAEAQSGICGASEIFNNPITYER